MSPLCPQEEEERKAREEQAQREHEEYLKLKAAFVVEEEGVGETMTEEQVGPPPRETLPAPTKAGPPIPDKQLHLTYLPQSGSKRWVGMRASRL